MTDFPVHPAAALFPLMEGDELRALADGIRAHGLYDPIVMIGGAVLDGRNRLAACGLSGVEPRFREFTGESPTAFVLSMNLARRHLTAGQIALVSAASVDLFRAESRERMAAGGRKGGGDKRSEKALADRGCHEPPHPRSDRGCHETRSPRKGRATEKAAAVTGAGIDATEKMRSVAAKAPEVAVVVKAGKATVADAVRAAKLPEAQREAVVARVTSGEAPTLKQALAAAGSEGEAPRDAIGRLLPAEIAVDFLALASKYKRANNLALLLVAALGELQKEAWRGATMAIRLRETVQQVGLEIRQHTPESTCPHCKLHPPLRAECEHCGGRGFVSVRQWRETAPEFQIGGAEAIVLWPPTGERRPVHLADLVAGSIR